MTPSDSVATSPAKTKTPETKTPAHSASNGRGKSSGNGRRLVNPHVIRAIFRRNFVSYFSNPTGYVFICVFVLLSGFAAFWPNEFFNANLANLNQLNTYLPYIMLVFIPAITMSIWAEERRQGTDELLLTIPASDFDVVIGKYLAAVAIFSVSLLFSVSNVIVLSVLGNPDLGLLLGNYVGYWLMGCAMLSIGMVASFLTSNLTVGFILGAAFNAPLAFAASADVIFSPATAVAIKRWSLTEQFRDFGRGVISFSSVAFFALIIVAMLYLSMVLISRRHWAGQKQHRILVAHYWARALALVAVLIGANVVLARHDVRVDTTSERLSSLSPRTKQLLQNLDPQRPVLIEAFISPQVPESYVQTQLNLLTMLKEFDSLGGDKVQVQVHRTERFSEAAERAEKQYDIKPQTVDSRTRGALTRDDIFLGVAFTSGLEKVVVPFFDRGIPVEYELIRSLGTVSQQERKKVGVLATDARIFGGFDMQSMAPTQNELIIDELEKQYEVVQVNADSPITETYDVLLAVQPSSLNPEQMENFVAAVRDGQPTVIFEDPFPYLDPSVPGTVVPKRPQQGGMFGMNQGPPEPKGNIHALWDLLGVDFLDNQVVWQSYNPYPKISQFPREFVFVDNGVSSERPFNEDQQVSSGLQQMLYLFPGAIRGRNDTSLRFTPLVRTGRDTGIVRHSEILEQSFFGPGMLNPHRRMVPTGESYILAALIEGTPSEPNQPMNDEGSPELEVDAIELADEIEVDVEATEEFEAATDAKAGPIKVVLVSDIDAIYSAFFALRARGDDPDSIVSLNLDNVSFVLNALDTLAGDDRFVEIRKRRPQHRTLTKIEDWTERSRQEANLAREDFQDEFNQQIEEEQAKLDEEVQKLQSRQDLDQIQMVIEVDRLRRIGEKRLEAKRSQLTQERDRKIQQVDRSLELEVRSLQDRCKLLAVLLPPIPPLLVGAYVFVQRRNREREGVARSRLR